MAVETVIVNGKCCNIKSKTCQALFEIAHSVTNTNATSHSHIKPCVHRYTYSTNSILADLSIQ